MMSYLLDTDWLIQALHGRHTAVSTLGQLAGSRVAISVITIAEAYEGAFRSPDPQAYLTSVRHFASAYRILGLNDAIAEQFAELRAHLRHRGALIPDFDLLIGATALQYDLTLLTFNRRHFERIPGLRLHSRDRN
jgi:tRNA(fMet)-specific endonuclease VapC